MIRKSVLAMCLAVMSAVPALAHDGEPDKPKHGGKVVASGHHHFEVVARDGEIAVHVESDDLKAEDVANANGSAAILSGGKKTDVKLAPDGSGALRGTGAFSAGKGTVIIVTLTLPGHGPEQVRVTLD